MDRIKPAAEVQPIAQQQEIAAKLKELQYETWRLLSLMSQEKAEANEAVDYWVNQWNSGRIPDSTPKVEAALQEMAKSFDALDSAFDVVWNNSEEEEEEIAVPHAEALLEAASRFEAAYRAFKSLPPGCKNPEWLNNLCGFAKRLETNVKDLVPVREHLGHARQVVEQREAKARGQERG